MKLTPWPTPVSCRRVEIIEDVGMEDVYSDSEETILLMDMDSGLGKSLDVNEQREDGSGDIKMTEDTECSSPSTEKMEDCENCEEDEETDDEVSIEEERKYSRNLVSLTYREWYAHMIAVKKYLYDVHQASIEKGLTFSIHLLINRNEYPHRREVV